MALDVVGTLFAETRDYKNLPAQANGQQANELSKMRGTLAAMIAKSGDGVGYAPPQQPSVADLGNPDVFATWQACVAAAGAPIPPSDPNANIAFFWKDDPQQDDSCRLRYSWLDQASTATAVGRAGYGNSNITLWTMTSKTVTGRYPDDRPRLEYALVGSGSTANLFLGGLLFAVCLLLLLVPAYYIQNTAEDTMAPASLLDLQDLNIANERYIELVARLSSGSKEVTSQAAGSQNVKEAFQKVADARSKAFCADPAKNCDEIIAARTTSIIVPWLVSLISIVGLMSLISWSIRGQVGGFLVDERGRMSLSRFQFVVWTVVILSAYWTAAAWDIGIAAKVHGAVLPVLTQDLWILLGIVTASPLASALILGPKTQMTSNPNAKPAAGVPPSESTHVGTLDARRGPDAWSFVDLFIGEETENRSSVDISRVQQFVFTLVTLLAFVSLALELFGHLPPGLRIVQLPPLDSTIVGLLAISHAAYLAAKSLPKTGSNAAPQ